MSAGDFGDQFGASVDQMVARDPWVSDWFGDGAAHVVMTIMLVFNYVGGFLLAGLVIWVAVWLVRREPQEPDPFYGGMNRKQWAVYGGWGIFKVGKFMWGLAMTSGTTLFQWMRHGKVRRPQSKWPK